MPFKPYKTTASAPVPAGTHKVHVNYYMIHKKPQSSYKMSDENMPLSTMKKRLEAARRRKATLANKKKAPARKVKRIHHDEYM